MKGFLQRIAAAAIRPEPRLKPLVGSIYAGDQGIDFAEEKPSLLLDPPHAIRPHAPSQLAPERIETRITHAHEPSPRETPVHHEPLIAMPQPFPPSLASVVSQLTAPKQTVSVPATHAPQQSGSKETAVETAPSPSLPAQHSGRTEARSQPPATISVASGASQQSERRVAQFMPIATNRELRQPAASTAKNLIPQLVPRQTAAQANTSEEIQIHIGRIEVIAVPPPGTAAPAASRSRATSLDDYLKRRNGRAG